MASVCGWCFVAKGDLSTPSASLVSSSPDVKLGSLTLIRHKMTLSHFSKGLIRPGSEGQLAGAVFSIVTDSPSETGGVPRRGGGGG